MLRLRGRRQRERHRHMTDSVSGLLRATISQTKANIRQRKGA
jgi:hypothetical protein